MTRRTLARFAWLQDSVLRKDALYFDAPNWVVPGSLILGGVAYATRTC